MTRQVNDFTPQIESLSLSLSHCAWRTCRSPSVSVPRESAGVPLSLCLEHLQVSLPLYNWSFCSCPSVSVHGRASGAPLALCLVDLTASVPRGSAGVFPSVYLEVPRVSLHLKSCWSHYISIPE